MAKKPVDHDATMDVSLSQLVVEERAPKPAPKPAPNPANNDVSLWAYRVVGSEDFAPPPEPQAAPRARSWLVVALLLVMLGAGAFLLGRYVL